MSGERNRRSLAFRGGGLAVTGSSGVGGSNSNSCEAQACQDRNLNGNRPDQEEDRDLGAKGPSQERVEGGGSVSDSTEPEAEEEEDPEGGIWADGDGEDRVGWVAVTVGEDESRKGSSWTAGNRLNSEDGAGLGSGGTVSEDDRGEAGSGGDGEQGTGGGRKCWVEMRPQTLLQKHSLFQASWRQEFPWLKFCQETGLMSCSWCHNIPTKNDELVKGSRNYKRALLLRHHLSSEHERNDPTKQELERPGCEDPPQGTDMETEDYYRNNKPNQDSYCYQLLQELNKQRKGGILCDVNIVVSGEVFRAHKNILVAGSRYFKTLYCLTKSENSSSTSSSSSSCDQTTTVTDTHLDVAAVAGFSVILDFLYSGNLLLTSQNAIDVMSVASYLQMTEVVGSCRSFIKEALNISIKQEAPDSVVVDYNKRRPVAKDGAGQVGSDGSTNKKPGCNFWATSILSKLSIKASGHVKDGDQAGGGSVKEEPSDVELSTGEGCGLGSSSWGCENSSESAENEPPSVPGPGPVFVWNEPAPGAAAGGVVAVKREGQRVEPGSGRRKKQITRRFVYNIPPEPEEGFDEGMFIQPSASYPREDFSFLSENAELANQIQDSLLQLSSQQGESWENGESSDTALNKLKCPHCNYIAKHRRTLKRHLIIHSGVRSFSCDICGKLFTRREHVKRHSLVHKKDKKYKCMVCKKIFMLAASVGIRHGSRRYGVCVDCADSHQATQEGLESMEGFVRENDDFGEGEEPDEDIAEEDMPNGNDQSNWEEGDTGAALENE
ncbi:LOW QUALITY PROTEIN: zinc finger and BTB domain-containing protein 10-like [Coregonus clupeaformis]|uniref:LOW QUALITY PROTEIN: zinc finger and BTB domain-containing protein 10-like n=1 Tax=Coregonus clupeaformis TaxID=59861 RepID=UPI001E1C866A|nr:LOW QUALITY PROTEIN: zinc finger and BTB domain-containing protein 10-like [Coregonus clupeaformis]